MRPAHCRVEWTRIICSCISYPFFCSCASLILGPGPLRWTSHSGIKLFDIRALRQRSKALSTDLYPSSSILTPHNRHSSRRNCRYLRNIKICRSQMARTVRSTWYILRACARSAANIPESATLPRHPRIPRPCLTGPGCRDDATVQHGMGPWQRAAELCQGGCWVLRSTQYPLMLNGLDRREGSGLLHLSRAK